MPVADAEDGGVGLQDHSAERGRHRSDAQGRHKQPAAVHHGSRASLAGAALHVQGHLQAEPSLMQGTWKTARCSC